jgi:hypothetical protein
MESTLQSSEYNRQAARRSTALMVVVVTMLHTEIDELEYNCSHTNDCAEIAVSIICCIKAIWQKGSE